jgi:hypothetical protein
VSDDYVPYAERERRRRETATSSQDSNPREVRDALIIAVLGRLAGGYGRNDTDYIEAFTPVSVPGVGDFQAAPQTSRRVAAHEAWKRLSDGQRQWYLDSSGLVEWMSTPCRVEMFPGYSLPGATTIGETSFNDPDSGREIRSGGRRYGALFSCDGGFWLFLNEKIWGSLSKEKHHYYQVWAHDRVPLESVSPEVLTPYTLRALLEKMGDDGRSASNRRIG